MRCLKCGYISFDKVETCSKCATSLAEVSEGLSGTVLKVQAPFFLASVLSEARDDLGGEEFDLSEAMDDVVDGDVSEEEVDVGTDEGEDFELDEDESDVPSIDLSQFEGQDESLEEEDGDVEEVDGVDVFQVEEEDVSGIEVEEPEESADLDGSIDFELDSEEDETGSIDVEEEVEVELDSIELDDLDLGVEPESEPEQVIESAGEIAEIEEIEEVEDIEEVKAEGGISLDLDVELEDEPLEDEMVFNLEDIDMSDLVIEEGDAAPSGDEVALDLENFLADGGDAGEEELEDLPMDLNLEDGELVSEDSNFKLDDDEQDLPEIEL